MKRFFILILILLKANSVLVVAQNNSCDCDTIYTTNDTLVIVPEYNIADIEAFIKFNKEVAKPPPVRLGRIEARARVFVALDRKSVV
jgi:hypothetical protein